MNEAPQFVQLAFCNMQLAPQVQCDSTTMQSGAIQLSTHGIFVDLYNAPRGTDGSSFRQGAHGGLKNSCFTFQTIVGGCIAQDHTTSASFTKRLRLTMIETIFDQFTQSKWNPVILTAFVRAIKRVPIHFRILD
jgi:hypothetical protein